MSIASMSVIYPTTEISSGPRLILDLLCNRNRVLDSFSSVAWSKSSKNGSRTLIMSSVAASGAGEVASSNEKKVHDMVLKQAANAKRWFLSTETTEPKPEIVVPGSSRELNEAYDHCRQILEEYTKTFYLGTLLMKPERRRAVWAIYAWFRRIDELVDGPNSSHTTLKTLDEWEARLEDIFKGRPHDMLDAALSDTIAKYPADIQLYKDVIEGMRMDLYKSRYKNFDELYLFCYYEAVTGALMAVPIMGVAPESQATIESIYHGALSLGIASQLTNILRDVGEDARRGRIYLPQDELAQAGLSDEDIFAGKVTDKWRNFMKMQIERTRKFYDDGEGVLTEFSADSRWPLWASLLLSRQILDEIEANDYNNLTTAVCASKAKKIMTLPMAYAKSLVPPLSTNSSRKQEMSTSTIIEK